MHDAIDHDQLSLLDPPTGPRHPTGVQRNLSALGQSWEHANLHAEVLTVRPSAIAGMVRGTDPTPAQAAAVRVLPKLGAIQTIVVAQLRKLGPRTAKELERLEVFSGFGASTVRKRVSELRKMDPPVIEDTGENRDGCAVWRLKEGV